MAKTVVGMFDDTMHARQAVEDLVDSGFAREDISLVARGSDEDIEHFDARGEDVSQGAGIGAALGGIGGLLVGLGALAIPGVGPVVAAGTIGTALAGAGVGALAGGLIGALVDAGIPDEHAEIYTEGVRRGGTLVMVDTTNEMAERAVSILNRHNPVDVERRAEQWRQQDWTGFNPEADPYTSQDLERERMRYRDQYATERDTEFETPLDDEDVRMGERDYETGSVRGYSRLTEDRLEEDVTMHEEDINVGRRDTETPTSGMPTAGADYETYEDRPVGSGMGTTHRTFEDYDTDFRRHYDTRYGATSSYDYAMYRPHYRYGYDLGMDERYQGRNWEDFEMDARREYESRNPDTVWEDIKDAVREGWRSVTGR